MALSWALCVATHRRGEILPRCVRAALKQTRPPAEIIIIDATPDSTEARQQVQADVAASGLSVHLHYEYVSIGKLTAQRNRAVDVSTADVLFIFDDDTLMFPECAERIMRVYEDARCEAIVGLQPGLAAIAPDKADVPTPVVEDMSQRGITGRINRMIKGRFFPRYRFDRCPPPEPPEPNVYFREDLHGARLTVRGRVARRCRYDEAMLLNWHDDTAISWMWGGYGLLADLQEPLVCHEESPRPVGEPRRGFVSRAGWMLNHAYLCLKYFPEYPGIRRHVLRHLYGSLLLDFLKGVKSRDFSQFRGMWFARRGVRRMLNAAVEQRAEILQAESLAARQYASERL